APRRARKRVEGTASSNVFSMFDQSQIQEFKEAFTIMDQNRDGFIDKEDLRDTFAALGRINVKNEELEAMVKEAPGPINFTVFLTMFGEKLKGSHCAELFYESSRPQSRGPLWGQGREWLAEARTQKRLYCTPSKCLTLKEKALSRLTSLRKSL
ncbi:myosin light chain 2, precursor lymphocyte-specific, isoform CRA_a, partial [Mus musculus]